MYCLPPVLNVTIAELLKQHYEWSFKNSIHVISQNQRKQYLWASLCTARGQLWYKIAFLFFITSLFFGSCISGHLAVPRGWTPSWCWFDCNFSCASQCSWKKRANMTKKTVRIDFSPPVIRSISYKRLYSSHLLTEITVPWTKEITLCCLIAIYSSPRNFRPHFSPALSSAINRQRLLT